MTNFSFAPDVPRGRTLRLLLPADLPRLQPLLKTIGQRDAKEPHMEDWIYPKDKRAGTTHGGSWDPSDVVREKGAAQVLRISTTPGGKNNLQLVTSRAAETNVTMKNHAGDRSSAWSDALGRAIPLNCRQMRGTHTVPQKVQTTWKSAEQYGTNADARSRVLRWLSADLLLPNTGGTKPL